MYKAENQINDLEDKEEKKIYQNSKKKKRIPKNKATIRSLWDNFTCTNTWIIGVPEEEERARN